MGKAAKKPTKDFFISYTSSDRKWAEWVASTLKSDGHSTIIQSWDFGPGCNFVVEMHKALLACRRVVLIYSPAYFESLYTQAEWAAAFAGDPAGVSGTLLPIRVKHCAPAGLLRPIVYVDLVDVLEEEARNRLLLAARPPKPPRGKLDRFPGKRSRPERTAFDIASELRDVLDTTRLTFTAQCKVRNKLYDTMRRRLKTKGQLEFEDFFHQHFKRMNESELHQHAIIRGFTKDVLRDYNERALQLCQELLRTHSEDVDLEEEVPSLNDLHEHLTVWLMKYKTAIRNRWTCLVYVGVDEGIGFPENVERELADLVAPRDMGARIIRRRRQPFGE
ncbi:MAG: toll/interleukin-1 receptor domain-containing protein [Steroidobacteraceae bacterium]